MERKNLDNNPIPSYLYFGQQKFCVRYQGQNTTCGYCAEDDQIERNCLKKANMKILAKNSKLHRRQAPQNENQQKEPPTKEKVAKPFERDRHKKRRKKIKPTNAFSPTPAIHRSTRRRNENTRQLNKSGHYLIWMQK